MIGVFDSGSGGLTVLRALESALPDEAFVYLGDHGNAPYGNRAPDEIYDLTLLSLARLFDYGCSLVVIACNTAAATGLRKLQQTWLPRLYPDRRVIGVIVPVVEEITGVPWSAKPAIKPLYPDQPAKRVAIFATQHTVRSNAYVVEVQNRNPAVQVYQRACPGLVPLIEQAAPERILCNEVRENVQALLETVPAMPDVCVLGCTHYPLVEHIFRDELPDVVRIISQSEVCAQSFVEYLKMHPHFSHAGSGSNQYFTTGEIDQVSDLASRFYNSKVEFLKMPGLDYRYAV
ncbi:MAG: glutamate racemase [Zavarzinia sp.]|nr:glutamate racemase [Zavarzinia sp.]